jgi:hypothetical protein
MEVGRPKTEDGRWKTEDRSRMLDIGCGMSEPGILKPTNDLKVAKFTKGLV